VRNDASHSPLLFQTSDTTWQAYNDWGGASFYEGNGIAGRAFKVSYNRPFTTRGTHPYSYLFNAEYPMIRWLEANGYDVSYMSEIDTDRSGSLLLQHKVFLSVGHDEYWSGQQRANVEAARAAGVNLAFFSGNAVFWKTRWENSIGPSNTPYRTLVCYKETLTGGKIDPSPTWTGSWRDPSVSPPADGNRPENALMGTSFLVNGPEYDAITVPPQYAGMRLWRDTGMSTSQTTTFPLGTLGYEWDSAPDNGFAPPGLVYYSSTTLDVPDAHGPFSTGMLLDYGATYGPGTATHHLTLYRSSSGSLVFGAGTVQWSWGLDTNHDVPTGVGAPSTLSTDPHMQQATVNLLADMGTQPGSLQAGLVAESASTDTTPPSSQITAPASNAVLEIGQTITINGTATDVGGGKVAGVEISTDGGKTWTRASGLGAWSYSWTPSALGPATIQTRSVDDSGNLETPSAGVNVQIVRSMWSASATPTEPSYADANALELGVKFHTDVSGSITGIRFYKGADNTGTHIGHLWSNTGALLAQATFTSESASGWQQVLFATPVSVTANTIYVASYYAPAGNPAVDRPFFTSSVDLSPLHFPADAGLYRYGSGGGFPTNTYASTNYWVDVIFSTSAATQTCPCSMWSASVIPSAPSHADAHALELGVKFYADVSGSITGIRFYKGAGNTGTHIGHLWSNTGALLAQATFTSESASGWQQVLFATPVSVTANTIYVASYYAPAGNPAVDRPFFTSSVDNAPLHFLADAPSGGDGLYLYGSGGGFPTNTYASTNYWVDVIFTTP
jgi:hypothetical protein